MEILVKRFNVTEHSAVSNVFVDDEYHSHFLEDTVRETLVDGEWQWNPLNKQYGVTAIPSGIYKVIISFSKRFQKELPLLLDVPNFTGIRMHPGNAPKNTEGCLLPGMTWKDTQPDWVGSSVVAFDPLFEKIKAVLDESGDVNIRIVNDFLPEGVTFWQPSQLKG